MKQVTENFWISQQPTAQDIADAAARGIVRIVNNRPDGEELDQPAAAESREVAKSSGLDYVHIPVIPGRIGVAQVRALQKAVAEASGPVLAHCRSGARSLTLWAIGEVLDGRMKISDIDSLGARMGIDLTGAKSWLSANA